MNPIDDRFVVDSHAAPLIEKSNLSNSIENSIRPLSIENITEPLSPARISTPVKISSFVTPEEKTQIVTILEQAKTELIQEITLLLADAPIDQINLYKTLINKRVDEHIKNLDDMGFHFQQLYFAINTNLKKTPLDFEFSLRRKEGNLAPLFDNSVPDRAVVTYIEQLVKFKSSLQSQKSINENDIAAIDHCLVAMKESLKLALPVTLVVTNVGLEQKVAKTTLEAKLNSQLKNMNEGDVVYIPAGYMRGTTRDVIDSMRYEDYKDHFRKMAMSNKKTFGHAVFIRCTKISNNYEFDVYDAMSHNSPKPSDVRSVKPTTFRAPLDEAGLQKFCSDLARCTQLKGFNEAPDTTFSNCFSGFEKIKDKNFISNHYRRQEINNCAQFSLRSFISTEIPEQLFKELDQFMINEGIKNCNSYLNQESGFLYKHPALQPKNKFHFLTVWATSILFHQKNISHVDDYVAYSINGKPASEFLGKLRRTFYEKSYSEHKNKIQYLLLNARGLIMEQDYEGLKAVTLKLGQARVNYALQIGKTLEEIKQLELDSPLFRSIDEKANEEVHLKKMLKDPSELDLLMINKFGLEAIFQHFDHLGSYAELQAIYDASVG